jgi:hypothetical protein
MYICLFMTILFSFFSFYVYVFPEKWEGIVRKENQIWLKKDFLSEKTVKWFVQFETGRTFKGLLVMCALFSLIAFVTLKYRF